MTVAMHAGSGVDLCAAAEFGGNDALRYASTGGTDSKLLLLSFWVKPSASSTLFSPNAGQAYDDGASSGQHDHFVYLDNGTALSIWFFSNTYNDGTSASQAALEVNKTGALVLNRWNHVLFSCDLSDTGKRHLYINDSAVSPTYARYRDIAMDIDSRGFNIGENSAQSNDFMGSMAEVFYAPGQYLDLSVTANRRKFIGGNFKPVDLGADGSTPTGTAPLLYFSRSLGEAVADFQNNAGSLGDVFTLTGTLVADNTPIRALF